MATATGPNAAGWISSKIESVHELTGQLRPFAFVFVLEVDVGIFPAGLVLANHASPLVQIGVGVAFVAQPEVPVGGRWHDRGGSRVAVGEAEREVPGAQPLVDGIV